jgi:hypothetical protein
MTLSKGMGTSLPPLANDGQDSGNSPASPFWKMHIVPAAGSTVEQQWLDGFSPISVSGDAAAIWMREFSGVVKAVWFNILPVGWIGEWHSSPALQWVVPLSRRWFIETQDGIRVKMGTGAIHWGADIAAGAPHSQIGHRSGQLGDVPCVQLMVQFHDVDDQGIVPSQK